MRIPLCGLLLLAPVLLASFPPARAASPPPQPQPALSPATLCEQAIAGAELRGRTPPGMLAAIGQVESGRPDPKTGAVRPWPWTIDVGGQGQFFATKAQAMDAVAALQAQGVRSIDVGCMQVNLMHHPDAFASLTEAFDPGANAAYAVRFLTELYRQTKDWPKSVAAYHSATPDIAADYQRRVLAIWRQPMPPVPAVAAASASANALVTPDAASGLVYGTYGPSRRVFGLILPAGP
jgi:hypothetical protein